MFNPQPHPWPAPQPAPTTVRLATVTPIRAQHDPARVDALIELAHDTALSTRTMTGHGFDLHPDSAAQLARLLPNLTPAAAEAHLAVLVQCDDQVRQHDPENEDTRWYSAPGDHKEALDQLRTAATEVLHTDQANGAA